MTDTNKNTLSSSTLPPLPSMNNNNNNNNTTRGRSQSNTALTTTSTNNVVTDDTNVNPHNLALAQLAEFDDLFSRVGDNVMIRDILKKDSNLENVLTETERNQDKTFESFIEQHIQQIPLLCEMFDEVTRCENKLLDFESSIATFQERLTSTAEGIADMQAETVRLRTKVHNRKEVSDRLKQVYEALHETERFCEAISNASAVDEQFLMSIRQLESKIAFLADNDELDGSAIENDMRPKLEEAAHRAGGKIHEFLIRKLSSLTAENANISLHQQAIERQGQYAYSFLVKYNETIAREVSNYYTGIMTDVYRRNLRNTCREYADIVETAMKIKHFDPYATLESVVSLKGGPQQQDNIIRQTGFQDPRTLPVVNRPAPPNPFKTDSSQQDSSNNNNNNNKREESVSERFKNFFNRDNNNNSSNTNKNNQINLGNKRPAVFADFVFVLQGIDVSVGNRTMSFDPLIAQMLSKSFCWVHSLTNMLVKLVNSVVSEGRFLDHFFFLSTTATTDQEEAMLSSLFDGPLRQMQELVQLFISVSNDPVALLTAHRVVELSKNFVTQSCSPIPIMLLTIPLETIFACIGTRLNELIDVQCDNLRSLTSCAPFDKFPPTTAAATASSSTTSSGNNQQNQQQNSNINSNNNNSTSSSSTINSYDTSYKRFVNQVQSDRGLAAKLGPNEIVRRFASLAGQIITINSLKIDGSRVSSSSLDDCDRVIYDDRTSDKMLAQASMMASIIDQFASSHDCDLTKMICKVNSFAHIYFTWKNMEPEVPTTGNANNKQAKTGDENNNNNSTSDSKAASSNRRANKQHQQSSSGDNTNNNNTEFSAHQFTEEERQLVANTSSYTLLTSECRLIEEVLKMCVTEFVKLDAASVEIFNPMIELLKKCQKLVPTTTSGNDDVPSTSTSTSSSATTTATNPNLLPSEQELLSNVLIPFHKGWLDALTAVVQRLRVYFNEANDGAFRWVLKEYFYFLVDKVKKLHLLVTKYYPKSASVKSKIVGPSTFWTEITRLMS